LKIAIILDSWQGTLGLRRYSLENTKEIIRKYGGNRFHEIALFYSDLDDKFIEEIKTISSNYTNIRFYHIIIPKVSIFKYLRQLFLLKYHLSKVKPDMVYDYYQMSMFLIPGGKYKKIITIHDICPLEYSKISIWGKISISINYKIVLPLIINNVDEIIVPSQYTKSAVIKKYSLSQNKIKIIPNFNLIKKRKKITDAESINDFIKLYNIDVNKFKVLVIATDSPIENFETSVEAVSSFYHNYSNNIELLIIGNGSEEKILKILSDYSFKNFRLLGYISESDLNIVYSLADVFLFLSLCEGFGLPPLEAMSCGLPVIASNLTSIPEVCGNGALLVDPHDAKNISEVMNRIFGDESLRNEMISNGYLIINSSSGRENINGIFNTIEDKGG
jgi:glycosyltransferase involved in cell wall biosynthesis